MEVKLLFYTTKSRPWLIRIAQGLRHMLNSDKNPYDIHPDTTVLNGKIVAESNFAVEEIFYKDGTMFQAELGILGFRTTYMYEDDLLSKSCLSYKQLNEYLRDSSPNGYAIYVRNLKEYDKPKELSDYFTEKSYNDINQIFTDEVMIDGKWYRPINKAPQNMMYAYDSQGNKYILISVRPNWMCKILNKDKTLEIRRSVLKEMLQNVH